MSSIVCKFDFVSSEGEEARDVLIWLTLLPIARAGRVAFISGDRKAFFKKERTLRAELLSDLGDFKENVEAFQCLDDSLRVHHSRSQSFDETWVNEQIETEQFSQTVERFLDERSDFFEQLIKEKGESSGYVSLIQIVQHAIEDHFVSDVDPNKLYVSVTVWAELEIEVEYYARAERECFRDSEPKASIECIYPCLFMQVQFEAVSGSLGTATVSEMALA